MAGSRKPAKGTKANMHQQVHQFLITLSETDPLIWRRIQVPWNYSFWDLHVAIQDAMGWKDSHLHEFRLLNPKEQKLDVIGIPSDEFLDERQVKPGWEVQIGDYFDRESQPALYLYDFGDDWRHIVYYEGVDLAKAANSYPLCIGGARRCPPEDCGGIPGYLRFLEVIADQTHPEHGDYLEWVGGQYDPDSFDASRVVFDDPRARWREAFER